MPALPGLLVSRVVVHEIYKRKTGEPNVPLLTDLPVPLTSELEVFFAGRLIQTMQKAFGVRFQVDTVSEVPSLLAGLITDDDQLVRASRKLAIILQDAQPAISPAGLLVVLIGHTTHHQIVAVLKLEHETGVRSQLGENDGLKVFHITLERDLFLTQNTQVFKAAIFRTAREGERGGPPAPADIDIWMSDDQAGVGGTPVARFFREEFLACEYREAPEIMTQSFHAVAERFNNTIDDPEKRVRYGNALLAEMVSNSNMVVPRTFAEQHLEAEDRQPFLDALRQGGVGTARFRKDVSRIRTRLRRTSIRTEHGAEVVADPVMFEEGQVIIVPATADESDRIEIRDKIRSVNGR
jgi:hypothetical protein